MSKAKHNPNWGGARPGAGAPRRVIKLRIGQHVAVRLEDANGHAAPLAEYEVIAVAPSGLTLRLCL